MKLCDLKEIKTTPKTGSEVLTDNGAIIEYTLLDFWRWSVSDILSNATRGRFAEFIVGTAMNIDPMSSRGEWDAFDLITKDGIKIEVKSASYIQSWSQKKLSAISFSIKKAQYWDSEGSAQCGEPKRHADVYVFCHLKHTNQETIDPLKMEQWDFYVLPTFRLEGYARNQGSISINPIRKLTAPKKYAELEVEIQQAYKEEQAHRSDII